MSFKSFIIPMTFAAALAYSDNGDTLQVGAGDGLQLLSPGGEYRRFEIAAIALSVSPSPKSSKICLESEPQIPHRAVLMTTQSAAGSAGSGTRPANELITSTLGWWMRLSSAARITGA